MVSTDTKQRLKGTSKFVLELYKILMGTFLSLFIPQKCGNEMCSLYYNAHNTNLLHTVTLVYNAICFTFFMMLYTTELKRENWCIKYLDINPEKPIENLDDEIEDYPTLKAQMKTLNTMYRLQTEVCILLQVSNTVISVLDLSNRWAGSSSLTPLISYSILVFSKLSTTHMIADASIKKERAYSAYLAGPKTFNVIDKDHVKPNTTIELGKPNDPIKCSDIEIKL